MKAEDWIRVEDRLPEEKERFFANGTIGVVMSDDVLVLTDKMSIHIGILKYGNWFFIDSGNLRVVMGGRREGEGYIEDIEFITHWMPIVLPEEEKK